MTYAARIEQYPQVQGRCPSCHGRTLFLGQGGYVTCSYLSCPNPSAANHSLLLGASEPTARIQKLETALRDLFQFSDRPFITVAEADAFEAALAVAQKVIGPCSRCGHAAHSAYCNLGGDPPSYDVCGCADGLPDALSGVSRTPETTEGK